MRFERCSALLLVSILAIANVADSRCDAQEPVFEAIPASQRDLFRFDFKKWYFEDEAARKKAIADARERFPALQSLKPQVGSDPRALLDAILLSEELRTVARKVESFGEARLATDTTDPTFDAEFREGSDLDSEVKGESAFIVSEIAGFPQEKLDKFVADEPGLAKYRYFLTKSKASAAHRASPDTEVALAKLAGHLDPFEDTFRNLMIVRSPNAAVVVDGAEVRVTSRNAYGQLLRNPDRNVREQAFAKRIETYRSQGDLFAFALFEKTRAANTQAKMRAFEDGADEAYEKIELDPKTVDRVLAAFRNEAPLAIRFQNAEANYQRKALGLDSAEPWDLEASPAAFQPPLHTIDQAKAAILEATADFGADYRKELEHLLDPKNGRLDIVPGPNRDGGAFVVGVPGPSWILFMDGYEGRSDQVVTLAHESAHGVHFRLMFENDLPFYYSDHLDAALYFVEGCAKINELLILDTLANNATNDFERLFFKRQIASKLASVKFASMYWAALCSNFERDVVKRIAAGEIESPSEIHEVWGEYGRLWSIDFDAHPDLKYTWPETEHFLLDSRKYAQYLFAWVVALAVYERMQADPAAGERFASLMKKGFSEPADVMLMNELGIDLGDPALIERMFDLVEARVAEFEQAAAAAK